MVDQARNLHKNDNAAPLSTTAHLAATEDALMQARETVQSSSDVAAQLNATAILKPDQQTDFRKVPAADEGEFEQIHSEEQDSEASQSQKCSDSEFDMGSSSQNSHKPSEPVSKTNLTPSCGKAIATAQQQAVLNQSLASTNASACSPSLVSAPQAQMKKTNAPSRSNCSLPAPKLTMTTLQAALLNCKLPLGFKLLEESLAPTTNCNYEVLSDGEDHVVIDFHNVTSRQVQKAYETAKAQFRRDKEQYTRMTAATPAGFHGQQIPQNEPYRASGAVKKAKSSMLRAQFSGSVISPASVESPSSPVALSEKVEQKIKDGRQIDQVNFLACQRLVQRVYSKAFEMKCLTDDIFKLQASFLMNEFSSTRDLIAALTGTIKAGGGSPDISKLHEYTLDQICQLDLDKGCESQGQILKQPPQQPITALPPQVAPCTDNDQVKASSSKTNSKGSSSRSSKKIQKSNSMPQTVTTGKRLAQATLSNTGKLVKPEPKNLSLEESMFIQEWSAKLTPVEQGGIATIVEQAGHGNWDSGGNFEFDMADIPYETSIKIYRYIQTQSKPLRDKLEKQQRRAEERARLSQETTQLEQSKPSQPQPQPQAQPTMQAALSQFDAKTLSELLSRIPNLELSETQREAVYFYREEQEKRLASEHLDGDSGHARQVLAQHDLSLRRESQLDESGSSSGSSSDSDSDSDSDEDEDEENDSALGKRSCAQARGQDLSQAWREANQKRQRLS